MSNIFSQADDLFHQAKNNTNLITRYYQIAHATAKIQFAGSAMIPALTRALDHLVTSPNTSCSLTISVWDSKSTNIHFPQDIINNIFISKKNNYEQYKHFEHVRIYFNNENIYGVYKVESKILSLFDASSNRGILWTTNASKIPQYVNSRPFRSIIQWWSKHNNLLLIHSGAVGNEDGGVLLIGKSGSGKSCTALACLNSTLKYAGDDHVLISTEFPHRSYSLYNSCKLNKSDIGRYPHILKENSDIKNLNANKNIIFLNEIVPQNIIKRFPTNAILLPRVTNKKESRLIKITPAESLIALAPNTIFQLAGAGKEEFKKLTGLVRSIPNYILEIGNNDDDIPKIISDLLENGK